MDTIIIHATIITEHIILSVQGPLLIVTNHIIKQYQSINQGIEPTSTIIDVEEIFLSRKVVIQQLFPYFCTEKQLASIIN